MKTKKMLLAFLSAALLITAAGCQQSDNTKDSAEDKKTETTAAPTEEAKLPADGTLAQDTADDGEVPPSDEKPSTAPDETVNAASDQEISSVPETSSEAEGSPDFTLASFSDAEEHQTGEEISFTAEDLSYLFTVTDASFTDQRDEHAASQPDSVVLITYEYTPVSGSALLVDEYWGKVLNFYEDLSEERKEILMSIIKQTIIDTISNVLGIIDGSSTLNDCDLEPKLLLDNKDTENELQDTFLAYIEENHMK